MEFFYGIHYRFTLHLSKKIVNKFTLLFWSWFRLYVPQIISSKWKFVIWLSIYYFTETFLSSAKSFKQNLHLSLNSMTKYALQCKNNLNLEKKNLNNESYPFKMNLLFCLFWLNWSFFLAQQDQFKTSK